MKNTSNFISIMKYRIISVLLHLFFIAAAYAQPFSAIRRYDINDGISENTVRTVVQDSSKYIWLGTKDGICRFNGQNFQCYGGYPKTSDINLLNVNKLCLHSDGMRLWVGTVDGLYLFDPVSETFAPFNPELSLDIVINDLCYDGDGNLWVASDDGLLSYDEESGSVHIYRSGDEKGSLTSNIVLSLLKDSSGDIWVGTSDGLAFYHKGLDKFILHKWNRVHDGGAPYEINHLLEGKDGNIWIGTHYDGLLNYDRLSGTFESYNVSLSSTGNTWIRCLHETDSGNLYIGTEDGLFTFDPESRKVKHIKDFSKSVIYSLTQDHEGGTWVGTYFEGIYYIPPQNSNVSWFHDIQGENSLSGRAVSQFCEDDSGNMWIATEDEGLNYFNVSTQRFTHYKTDSPSAQRISHNNLHALMLDGKRLWIGTFSKGIDIMDTETGRVTGHYRSKPNDPDSLPDNHVYSIFRTSKGEVYVGTMRGFCRWVPADDTFHRFDEFDGIFVYDMIEDADGVLWIATKDDGVWRMKDDVFRAYLHDAADPSSIGSNHIIRSYIDTKGNLWFATEGCGICRYDYDSDSFVNYGHTKGLYHHIVYGILDNGDGNLWLSTTYGIVRYNPDTFETCIYTQEDGMQSNQFNYRSSMRSSDGKFWFGGINGFNCFNPESFRTTDVSPVTVIPEIVLHKKNSEIEYLKPSGKITIGPDIASFDISFECLSYLSPSKNRYAYKVEKLHDEWIYTSKPSVSFVDLAAGQYRIMVKSSNTDSVWNGEPACVDFVVRNPLWKTPVMKIFYILIAVLLMFIIVRRYRRDVSNKAEREKMQMEMQMEQESYRSKFQFFTHVAHEIKTPLSLIKAPLDVIIENGGCDAHIQENLLVMQQNVDRLLELIKQLLNFRKIDKEGYKLTYTSVEINDFIGSIVKRFDAADKSISISTKLQSMPLDVCIDAEAVTKILSNLLSNGLKYAHSVIIVQVESLEYEGNVNVVLSVADDGPGVSESEAEKIFEPFYRSADSNAENGFGIGLSLVKLLVEKLGGSIQAGRSQELGGLSVTVMIPQGTPEAVGRVYEKNAEKSAAVQVESHQANLLIVEDTKEMLDFLMKNLGGKFKVFGAANGKEAMEVLRNTTIDVVLSDVMMPQMDGFELLYNVRSDKMLCHIPMILLSAQGNVNSKIAGLDYGADAYIEKPFSISYVVATIDNLLKTRRLLFERFTSMPNLDYGKGGMKPNDVEWLEALTDIIKKNLTNEQFTVDTLASEMAVSRSNLRRKVLGVTGLPPNDYIRLVRLKVAAELLQSGKYRVNEVCSLIGFSSHSYFRTCFQQQFGVLPKDYVK